MGVRYYNWVTGAFTSPDPIPGGNHTSFGYPTDPINNTDTTGQWGWPKWVKKTARAVASAGRFVGNLASMCAWIPGSIGMACGAVSMIGYLAAGDLKNAAIGGMSLFTGGVGGGAYRIIRQGFKSRTVRTIAWTSINASRSSLGYATKYRRPAPPRYTPRHRTFRKESRWI